MFKARSEISASRATPPSRVAIENRWLPWEGRWEFDRGMRVDIGTPSDPTRLGTSVLIVDAGQDFVDVVR